MTSAIFGLTFEEVSERYDIERCDRVCVLGNLERHTSGFTHAGVVHWKDRGLTRRGLYAFLKLMVEARMSAKPLRVERLWRTAERAYDLGIDLGVRFSREETEADRAMVRAALAQQGFLLDRDLRERIERWARD